ncbi:MAG: ECF-type sigma factor [Acidobacteriota bacterium]
MSDHPARPTDVTRLLRRWTTGDEDALAELMPLLYVDLRQLARRRLRAMPAGRSLSPTDLVHEAFVRLVDAELSWSDRAHFFAVAAGTMRRVLVDHARHRSAQKRGGEAQRVTLDEAIAFDLDDPEAFLALHQALGRLGEKDARKAKALELHFFAGLTYDEAAEVLDVSPATVDRDLRFARAWLHKELAR